MKYVIILVAAGLAIVGSICLLALRTIAATPQPPVVCDQRCAHGECVRTTSSSAICSDLDTIFTTANAGCPVEHRALLAKVWASTQVDVVGARFACAYGYCTGTQEGPFIRVAGVDALPDEYGHIYWEACFDSSGEHIGTLSDGGLVPVQDAAYVAWVAPLRKEMR